MAPHVPQPRLSVSKGALDFILDATGPTYDLWARCWFCNEQKVHVVNEYERDYGD